MLGSVWFGKAVGVFFPDSEKPWVSSFPPSFPFCGKAVGVFFPALFFPAEKPWVSSFPVVRKSRGCLLSRLSRRRAANTGLESAHSAMGGSTEITFFWKFLRYQSGESSLISLSHLFLTRFRQVKVARRQSPRLPGTAM